MLEIKSLSNTGGDWRVQWDPAITPLFRAWWRFSRSVTLGVRGVACDEAGRVLLVRHTYTKGWHLPGGGVEHRETAADAVVREMAEEGGVQAVSTPRLIGFYANHANFANDHIALYRIDSWRPCAPKRDAEIAERNFFPIDALPEDITPGTRRRIAEIFHAAPIGATW
jgi:ADP-ribose pyrophosphatase YjhB (NUDIX family)